MSPNVANYYTSLILHVTPKIRSIIPAGTTWMQEIAYLITSRGDFQGAKAANVLQRSPFIEMDIPSKFSLLPKNVFYGRSVSHVSKFLNFCTFFFLVVNLNFGRPPPIQFSSLSFTNRLAPPGKS